MQGPRKAEDGIMVVLRSKCCRMASLRTGAHSSCNTRTRREREAIGASPAITPSEAQLESRWFTALRGRSWIDYMNPMTVRRISRGRSTSRCMPINTQTGLYNAVRRYASMAIILLLFTLLPRSKTTLLPPDFEHFSPNIDNFAPIQKGQFALYFIIFFFFWGGAGTGIKMVIKLKVHCFFFGTFFQTFIFKKVVPSYFQNLSTLFEARNATFFFFFLYYSIFS